ncbi:hypothetical protein I5K92_17045 [Serratia marcescens]|nr:hypothetical protein [Serratia marcescens]
MKIKLANRIIIGLIIILLSIVVLLLISTLYYSTDKKMELGSLTDWISAGANICMAGAALYAGSKAVNFFKEKAYDHAINLLSKFNELKVEIDTFHFDLMTETTRKAEHLYTESNPGNFELKLSSEKLKELDVKLAHLRRQSMNLLFSLNSTKRFGFEMKSEHKEKISVAISEYNNVAPMHLLNYKKNPDIIVLSIKSEKFKHLDDDQHDELENIKNILHEAYLELDSNINNIFNF